MRRMWRGNWKRRKGGREGQGRKEDSEARREGEVKERE